MALQIYNTSMIRVYSIYGLERGHLMRALIILICFSICSVSILTAQTEQKPAGTGTFKSIENWEVSFSLKDGKTSESRRILKHRSTFRPDGNKDEETFYNPDGSIITRMVFTYDLKGHCTGHEEYSPTPDKTLTLVRRHLFTLDNSWRRIEYKIIETSGELASRSTYRYDDNGKLIEEDSFPRTGQTMTRTLHTYDETGKLTSDLTYEGDKLTSSFLIKYDSAGDCAETRQYIGGKLHSTTVYVSDEKHRPISSERFVEDNQMGDSNGELEELMPTYRGGSGKVTITYDDAARTQETSTYNAAGVLTEREIKGFEQHGQQTSSSRFDGKGKTTDPVINFYNGNQLQGTLQGATIIQREYNDRGMLV